MNQFYDKFRAAFWSNYISLYISFCYLCRRLDKRKIYSSNDENKNNSSSSEIICQKNYITRNKSKGIKDEMQEKMPGVIELFQLH